MAGGIGSRFWPMSTPEFPKQFHDILGIGKSLIRMTYERITPIVADKNILVVTNEKYKEQVSEHIPELEDHQILCEPFMRNTAPCLAYAHFKIQAECRNANIIVCSADQLITNETKFLEDLEKGLSAAVNHKTLVTIGIKPSSPNTGYGYIQFGEKEIEPEVREVITFTEKPDLELARTFVQSGEFYWNAGIFIWTLQSVQEEFKKHLPEVYDLFNENKAGLNGSSEEETIYEVYSKCPNISVDYGILEKARNVMVVLSDFGWSDLGTWGSVYAHLDKDDKLNASDPLEVKFHESSGNIVKLESLNKAVIQGLEDYIVVEYNGTLLICKKSEEQRIKQFSKLR